MAQSLIRLQVESNQYEQKMRKAKRQFEDFTASIGINMKKMTAYGLAAGAAASAINGLTSAMSEAVTEGIRMSKEMEGVKAAFNRLNQPNLLNNLREATHGTVNDLELMKQAVKFDNFNLSLDQMGTMLAFAQQQAKDTGQDVGYLVDSIVTGLGRKSLPILDNLGLSATEIRERMKETGDMTKAVASIIQDRMNAAGGYVETAADRSAKATAEMQNAMMELGQVFAPLTESANTFFSAVQIGAIRALTYIGKLMNTLSSTGRAANVASGEDAGIQKGLGKLRVAKAAGSDYMAKSLYNDQVESYNRRINDYDAQIKNGGKKPGAGSGESRDIRWLQAQRDGLVIARDQYIQQAKQIMTPIVNNTTVDTGGSGSGGGKGGKGGFDVSSIAFDANKAMLSGVKAEDMMPSVAEMVKPENILGHADEWEKYKETITGSIGSVGEAMTNLTQWTEDFDPFQESMDKMNKSAMQSKMAFGLAANAAGALGGALAGMEDPGVRAAGIVLQSIASIAMGFAEAAASPLVTGTGWGWLAFVAAGVAAMATTISTIHQLTGFAEGGIVGGNQYSGDNIYAGNAMVNSGELVLNKAQQGNLASQLQGNGINGMNISGRIKGTDIILSVDRSLQLQGKQMLTWG